MTDERRFEILENYYQEEVKTMKIGQAYDSNAFLSRGLTRGLLVVAIMQSLNLLSDKDSEKYRLNLLKMRKGENYE